MLHFGNSARGCSWHSSGFGNLPSSAIILCSVEVMAVRCPRTSGAGLLPENLLLQVSPSDRHPHRLLLRPKPFHAKGGETSAQTQLWTPHQELGESLPQGQRFLSLLTRAGNSGFTHPHTHSCKRFSSDRWATLAPQNLGSIVSPNVHPPRTSEQGLCR